MEEKNNELGENDGKIDAILSASKLTWQANVYIYMFTSLRHLRGKREGKQREKKRYLA